MGTLNKSFFDDRSRKWWIGLTAYLMLFFLGTFKEFGDMNIGDSVSASRTADAYRMMFFCSLLLLIYLLPFAFFVRYSCSRMRVTQKLPIIAFLTGWFIPGWISGYLNDTLLDQMIRLTSKSFANAWGPAIIGPLTEETLKILLGVLLLILIGYRKREQFLITGMCVGMGFKLSEDLGYIEKQVTGSYSDLVNSIGFTLEGRVGEMLVSSHWCYTALAAAAVWLIFYRNEKKSGILLLIAAYISHFLWNTELKNLSALVPAAITAVTFIIFLKVWIETLPEIRVKEKPQFH